MLLDKSFYQTQPCLKETFFRCLEESCSSPDKLCVMKVLCQIWFGCMGQNIIYHRFWLLCYQENFPHPCFYVPVSFYCFLYILLNCHFFSSLLVRPSSHRTVNDMSGDVLIFGEMWIFLDLRVRIGSWSVATCDDFIVLPYGRLAVILFDIMNGEIYGVASFPRWMFYPET